MKKYLLIIISLVCAVTGAWAEIPDGFTQIGGTNSYYKIDGTSITIHVATAGDFSTWVDALNESSAPILADVNACTSVTFTGALNNADLAKFDQFTTNGVDFDLTGASLAGDAAITSIAFANDNYNYTLLLPSTIPVSNNFLSNNYSNLTAISISGTTASFYIKSGGYSTNITAAKLAKCPSGMATIVLYSGGSGYDNETTHYGTAGNAIISNGDLAVLSKSNFGNNSTLTTLDLSHIQSWTENDYNTNISTPASTWTYVISPIGSISVSGTLTNEILTFLNGISTLTKIDLSNVSSIAGDINWGNLKDLSSLMAIVLPANTSLSSTDKTTLNTNNANLEYVYSQTSDAGVSVADYVWVNKSGGLKKAFVNEANLRSGIYVKVESTVSLNTDDVDFTYGNIGAAVSFQYLDASGAIITLENAATFKAPHWSPYRIILPDGTIPDHLAAFAANQNINAVAAVYSYGTGDKSTTLNILEIGDNSYASTALHDARIVREGTTALNIITGRSGAGAYGNFGSNLLTAINNAYNNGVGNGKDIVSLTVSTGASSQQCPNTLTISNPRLQYIHLDGLTNTSAVLDVTGCTALQTLDLSESTLTSIDASGCTNLAAVDLSGTTVSGATNLSGCTALTSAGLTSTALTNFGGELNLSGCANASFTSFSTPAKVAGDIKLNACSKLTSVNVSTTQFQNTSSKIHVDANSDEESEIISGLKNTNAITVPSGFDALSRVHPYNKDYVQVVTPVSTGVSKAATTMHLHSSDESDKYVYWYDGGSQADKDVTVTTSGSSSLTSLMTGDNPTFDANGGYVRVKIVGPLTAAEVSTTYLGAINTTVLDLSQAEVDNSTLKTFFTSNSLHANVKFLVLPSGSTREGLINATDLAGLYNSSTKVGVYCAIAKEDGVNGPNITSYSFVPGTVQPATVLILNSNYNDTWTRNGNKVYITDQRNTMGTVTLSGVLNAFDLAKGSSGLKLSADGHLEWEDSPALVEAVETTANNRVLKSTNEAVYGTFSTCNIVTELDLAGAKFQEGYITDMTLSYLGVVSAGTRKVVIPTDPSVNEIPADFMRDVTHIRSICIPSNIQIIRTRAFKSIDYVWTTSGTNDPEGANTKLDNGAVYAGSDDLVYGSTATDFSYIAVPTGGSYTFSSNVKLIETAAFANTQPHVKDVYVLNKVAPECHVDAFNTVMYLGNGGYNPVIQNGIITRDSYKNGAFWITMLHYPRQTTTPNVQRYTDPTRSYTTATGERDGKGGMLYYPNQSEFIRAYVQGTYGYTWNAWNPTREYGAVNNGDLTGHTTEPWRNTGQSAANALFNSYTTGGTDHQYTSFYDLTNNSGTNVTDGTVVPYYQVNWDESSYSTLAQGNLYPQSESGSDLDSDGMITSKDYRGWHQFVLNAFASNTTLVNEPYRSYVTDNGWWTFCPTFDMTKSDVVKLFGDESSSSSPLPYVSKLLYVIRHYKVGGDNRIQLVFSDNLMENKEARSAATDQHGTLDANGVLNISGTVADNDVVMSAGVPYLIRPNIPNANIRMFQVYATEGERDKMLGQYTEDQQAALPFRWIVDENLYNRMHVAKSLTGTQQMAQIHSGKYTVPVFVKVEEGASVVENLVGGKTNPNTFTVNSESYNKSADWKYTFVGTFYHSFIPQYSYFLGWNGSSAQFYYNDSYDEHNKRWINETGVICPTNGAFGYTITQASGKEPAQWMINQQLSDDWFTGSSSRKFDMVFNEAIDGGATGIKDFGQEHSRITNSVKVYSLDGQQKGNTLKGLSKGIYIVNGKKFVVK